MSNHMENRLYEHNWETTIIFPRFCCIIQNGSFSPFIGLGVFLSILEQKEYTRYFHDTDISFIPVGQTYFDSHLHRIFSFHYESAVRNIGRPKDKINLSLIILQHAARVSFRNEYFDFLFFYQDEVIPDWFVPEWESRRYHVNESE